MDDGSGGRSQGLLHLHPQKYTGAESGVASPKAFIYRFIVNYLNFFIEKKNYHMVFNHLLVDKFHTSSDYFSCFYLFIGYFFI
jgi:hypothetical protein